MSESTHGKSIDALRRQEIPERQREIERSIIKTYRKSIWRPFTKALTEYDLIQSGDRIAVCISGGKDSMLMAKCFQELKRRNKFPFELVFLVMMFLQNACRGLPRSRLLTRI